MSISYLELLRLAAPETIVVVTALLVLAADLLAMRERPLGSRGHAAHRTENVKLIRAHPINSDIRRWQAAVSVCNE